MCCSSTTENYSHQLGDLAQRLDHMEQNRQGEGTAAGPEARDKQPGKAGRSVYPAVRLVYCLTVV